MFMWKEKKKARNFSKQNNRPIQQHNTKIYTKHKIIGQKNNPTNLIMVIEHSNQLERTFRIIPKYFKAKISKLLIVDLMGVQNQYRLKANIGLKILSNNDINLMKNKNIINIQPTSKMPKENWTNWLTRWQVSNKIRIAKWAKVESKRY